MSRMDWLTVLSGSLIVLFAAFPVLVATWD
jgi:hypothetical protein